MATREFTINMLTSSKEDGEYNLFLVPVLFFRKRNVGWSVGVCFLMWGIELEVSDESK